MGISQKIKDKGDYIRSAVLSANDGIITTFAVVSGSLGASLSPSIVVILGLANLFADGLSMSTGSYLGVKSEIEYEQNEGGKKTIGKRPLISGLVSFLSFGIVGFIPLISYVFRIDNSFNVSAVLVVFSLILVGVARGWVTNKNILRTATENLLIGGAAAFVAFYVGEFARRYLV